MITEFLSHARDLYKNPFLIMLSSITNAGFGSFFWMIAGFILLERWFGF